MKSHQPDLPIAFSASPPSEMDGANGSLWFQFRSMFAVHRLSWAAAVVVIVVVASGVGLRIQEDRRVEGEAAKRQVMLALRITGEKWQVAAKEISGKTDTQSDQSHRDTHPDTENQE